MNGTEKDSLMAADLQTVYEPDPKKLPPRSEINLLELARYSLATGKDIGKMSIEELAQFKNKD